MFAISPRKMPLHAKIAIESIICNSRGPGWNSGRLDMPPSQRNFLNSRSLNRNKLPNSKSLNFKKLPNSKSLNFKKLPRKKHEKLGAM